MPLLRLEANVLRRFSRAVQRLDRPRLSKGVLAPQKRLALTPTRRAHVVRLRARGNTRVGRGPPGAIVPPKFDHRCSAVERVVEEERALVADRFQLVAGGHAEAAVELADDTAWGAQRPVETHVDSRKPDDLLAVDPLWLAREQTRTIDAVGAHVHEG